MHAHMYVYEFIPQAVRFGLFSCKKDTRRAGWVARESELGARGPDGWHADRSRGPATLMRVTGAGPDRARGLEVGPARGVDWDRGGTRI